MKKLEDGTVILEDGNHGFKELVTEVEAVLNDPKTEVLHF